jgi:hypothetical protein
MKHATPQSLDQLEGLLDDIRRHGVLKEKSRGVFYLRSRAVLHFHEDPAGLFADFRPAEEWERFKVDTKAGQTALLRGLQRLLSA